MCEIKEELNKMDEMLHGWGAWARTEGYKQLGYSSQSPEAKYITSEIDNSDKFYPLNDEIAERIDRVVARMSKGMAHQRKIADIIYLRYVKNVRLAKIAKIIKESETRTRELRGQGLTLVAMCITLRDFSDDNF